MFARIFENVMETSFLALGKGFKWCEVSECPEGTLGNGVPVTSMLILHLLLHSRQGEYHTYLYSVTKCSIVQSCNRCQCTTKHWHNTAARFAVVWIGRPLPPIHLFFCTCCPEGGKTWVMVSMLPKPNLKGQLSPKCNLGYFFLIYPRQSFV